MVAGVVAAVVVAVVWPREREPEYGGKKLSEWLTQYSKGVSREGLAPEAREAAGAVRHIGTNALPWLLRWVRYEQPRWQGMVYSLMEKMPPPLRIRFLMKRLDPFGAERPYTLAIFAFGILGEQASPAVPELERLMNDPKPSAIAMRAVVCLGTAGFSTNAWEHFEYKGK